MYRHCSARLRGRVLLFLQGCLFGALSSRRSSLSPSPRLFSALVFNTRTLLVSLHQACGRTLLGEEEEAEGERDADGGRILEDTDTYRVASRDPGRSSCGRRTRGQKVSVGLLREASSPSSNAQSSPWAKASSSCSPSAAADVTRTQPKECLEAMLDDLTLARNLLSCLSYKARSPRERFQEETASSSPVSFSSLVLPPSSSSSPPLSSPFLLFIPPVLVDLRLPLQPEEETLLSSSSSSGKKREGRSGESPLEDPKDSSTARVPNSSRNMASGPAAAVVGEPCVVVVSSCSGSEECLQPYFVGHGPNHSAALAGRADARGGGEEEKEQDSCGGDPRGALFHSERFLSAQDAFHLLDDQERTTRRHHHSRLGKSSRGFLGREGGSRDERTGRLSPWSPPFSRGAAVAASSSFSSSSSSSLSSLSAMSSEHRAGRGGTRARRLRASCRRRRSDAKSLLVYPEDAVILVDEEGGASTREKSQQHVFSENFLTRLADITA